VLLHDAVWVLPADPRTREAFEWLAEEIEEHGGTAWTWEAVGLSAAQDRALAERFREGADARYAEIAESARAIHSAATRRRRRRGSGPASATAAQAVRQLKGLDRALRLESRRDYFRANGRAPAVQAVAMALEDLEARVEPESGGEGRARALGD
jgi:hypothetical protein